MAGEGSQDVVEKPLLRQGAVDESCCQGPVTLLELGRVQVRRQACIGMRPGLDLLEDDPCKAARIVGRGGCPG